MASEAERERLELAAKRAQFPTLPDTVTSCVEIDLQIEQLQRIAQGCSGEMAKGGCGDGCKRVNSRCVKIVNGLIAEKKKQRDGLRCTEYLENKKLQESAQVFEEGSVQAENRIGGTSNIHRYSMLIIGAVVIIGAVIIIRNR